MPKLNDIANMTFDESVEKYGLDKTRWASNPEIRLESYRLYLLKEKNKLEKELNRLKDLLKV